MDALLAPVPIVHFAGRFAGAQDVPYHDHPGTELVLVTAGCCAVRLQDHDVVLEAQAGDLLVLPANILHNQEGRGGEARTTYCNCTFPPRAFSERPRLLATGGTDAGTGAPPALAIWMEQLADLQRVDVPAAMRGGLALAVVEALHQIERVADRQRAQHPALVAAVRRIEQDLLEDLSVTDLARASDLSPSHLTALFRARFNCGPIAYRQKLRLELACRLLRNSYLSVAEVGASCGYPDANYFARQFRSEYGCSPKAWRS